MLTNILLGTYTLTLGIGALLVSIFTIIMAVDTGRKDLTRWAAALFITGALLLSIGVTNLVAANEPPVCHAKTEDSVIIDCDYRNGGWYRK